MGLFFLRFICPAIAAPAVCGLVAVVPPAPVRRVLVLLTKIVQNVASTAPFKESFMQDLTAIVDRNRGKMADFLTRLSSGEAADRPRRPEGTPPSWRPVSFTETVMDDLRAIQHYLTINLERMIYAFHEQRRVDPDGVEVVDFKRLIQIISRLHQSKTSFEESLVTIDKTRLLTTGVIKVEALQDPAEIDREFTDLNVGESKVLNTHAQYQGPDEDLSLVSARLLRLIFQLYLEVLLRLTRRPGPGPPPTFRKSSSLKSSPSFRKPRASSVMSTCQSLLPFLPVPRPGSISTTPSSFTSQSWLVCPSPFFFVVRSIARTNTKSASTYIP